MPDPRFARTVIYLIRHDASGAQGVVVNRPLGAIPLALLLEQMGMDTRGAAGSVRLHSGGPVETRRMLVLHSAEYSAEGTLPVKDGIAITWQPEILQAIAQGKGPRRVLFALGYAGWAPGQLDAEIQANGWLSVPADDDIVFASDDDSKWRRALGKLGVDLSMLSSDAGHA
jgi:putative transcriptional regulator